MSGGELLPQHLEYLNARAVSPEAVRARGYWSATESKQLERLFANREQRRLVPAMVIPVHDVWGNNGVAQIRPDEPRVIDGRSRKFEWPSKVSMAVDVPPIVQPILGDPSVPLVITEGSIKADAAVSAGLNAISLQGVWAWRGTNDKGGKTALPDLEAIAFNNRVVYMAFDSDAMVKMDVYRALRRFAELLAGRGAEIRIVYLPHGDGGCKTGLDDFLAGGRTAADLLALASDELREPGGAASNGKAEAPPEVDGELLLADLRGFIGRYMVLPSDEVADLLVLWTLHTHAIESAFATPYLRIVSAAPNSGKTLLLEILAKLTCRGWHAIMPSLAVMYRKVDAHSPTLLLDEMDGYNLDERTDALGVLNSGYKRGATVDRCKESGELEEFKTFCAKAFAGLDTKAMAPSLLSRTITIRLERKLPGEGTEMWIEQLTAPAAQELRERCAAWAFHNVGALNDARPELPRWLHNRAAEVWWALLAVADRIGGEWPARAREVSRVLGTGGDSTDEKPEIVMLLEDINAAFGASTTIFTEELLPKLNAIEERPWGALRRGEGLDARGLARKLRTLRIKPKQVRVDSETAKGYHRDQFADAFARHLPPSETRETSETWETSQAQRDGDVSHVSHVSPNTGPGGYVATHIATAVYLDCETSGKDSRTCELTTVAAAIDGDAPMAFRHPEQRAEIQAALDAAAIVVGWNVAYDVRVLERHGYRVADRWQDAALKAYASGRGLPGQLALKPTALAELGESIDVALDVCRAPELWVEAASRRRKRWAKRAGRKVAEAHPTTWAEIPDKILAERCKMDVELTRELDHHYELDGRLPQLVELENALLGPVYRMEQRGAPIDVSALEALLAETLGEVTLARARVKGLDPTVLGKGGGICANPLEAALAARGVDVSKLPRTERSAQLGRSEEVLNTINDDLARALVSYVKASKFRDMVAGLAPHVRGGRVFASFNPIGAELGRFSSSNPPMQNWPKVKTDPRMRRLLRAPAGRVLVGADLASIESCILAYFAGPGPLLRMLRAGEDNHAYTARHLDVDRDRGKIFNHSNAYGAGIRAIKSQLGCDDDAARRAQQAYLKAYPEIARLREGVRNRLRQRGYVETLFGRRQRFEPNDHRALHALTCGSAADLFKAAIIELDAAGVEIVSCVHDELIAECAEHDADRIGELIVTAMTRGTPEVNAVIPLKAEYHVGKSWADLK